MPRATRNFSEIYSTERVTLSFDFSPALAVGETLASPSASALLVSGIDPSPSSRLIGAPSIAGSIILQEVGNELSGATYNFLVTVATSAGQTLSLSAHQACQPIE